MSEKIKEFPNKKTEKEVDFIAKKGSKKYYIQVSNDISSLETKTREIRPFIALNDSFQ